MPGRFTSSKPNQTFNYITYPFVSPDGIKKKKPLLGLVESARRYPTPIEFEVTGTLHSYVHMLVFPFLTIVIDSLFMFQ